MICSRNCILPVPGCRVPHSATPTRPRVVQELVACNGTRESVLSQAALSRRQLQLALLSGIALNAVDLCAVAAPVPSKVFVAGSTGNTGSRVVKVLRSRGIEVVAGVRDVAKAEAAGFTKDSGISVQLADVTQPASELVKVLSGCDAVICATGGGAVTPFDKRAKQVDNLGTQHLVDAAKMANVGSFVLVSSLLTNAKATGQEKNPNYVVLQLFGGVLEEKLQAERYLRNSGLRWTIVRPGGLTNEAPEKVGNPIFSGEDTLFGVESDPGREISRTTVAEVCVEALLQDNAADKVIEIVASRAAPTKSPAQWFDV